MGQIAVAVVLVGPIAVGAVLRVVEVGFGQLAAEQVVAEGLQVAFGIGDLGQVAVGVVGVVGGSGGSGGRSGGEVFSDLRQIASRVLGEVFLVSSGIGDGFCPAVVGGGGGCGVGWAVGNGDRGRAVEGIIGICGTGVGFVEVTVISEAGEDLGEEFLFGCF